MTLDFLYMKTAIEKHPIFFKWKDIYYIIFSKYADK